MDEIMKLPVFEQPSSIKEAKLNITCLGRNMAEHAYLIGCNLIWIKSQLKHGEFELWVTNNLWRVPRTASRYIRFTEHCNLANSLVKYPIQANRTLCPISNEPPQIESGQYSTIIIDPPWPYETQYDPDTRRVGSPYPEMTVEAIGIMELPTADDCVLWLWTTHKFLPVSFEILENWGFDYKATLTWDKEKMGIGYWLRMQCEFCLLAIKGDIRWPVTSLRDIITEKRREHSRKPESFYEMVLDICPKPIGEAFSRQERKGITTIVSNEPSKFKIAL